MNILDPSLMFVGFFHVLWTLLKEFLDDFMLNQKLELVMMDLCGIQIDNFFLIQCLDLINNAKDLLLLQVLLLL